MSLFLCNNLVKEDINEHYIGYLFNDNGYFYNTLYQVIKKSSDEFLECFKLMNNGLIKVIYDVNEYRTYNAVAFNLSEVQYKRVVGSFVFTIKRIENKGFIQLETIDLEQDKIFICTEDCTVRLVCVPLNICSNWETQNCFKQNAVSALARMIYNSDYMNIPSLYKLFCDCNEGQVSFDEIYNRMLIGYYGEYFFDAGMLQSDNCDGNVSMILNSLVDGTQIQVNKSGFIIGTNHQGVDYAIMNSTKISRVHCEIIYRDKVFYIIDKESTNGTFVNGTRIPSDKLIPIQTGDNITLADLTYIVG